MIISDSYLFSFSSSNLKILNWSILRWQFFIIVLEHENVIIIEKPPYKQIQIFTILQFHSHTFQKKMVMTSNISTKFSLNKRNLIQWSLIFFVIHVILCLFMFSFIVDIVNVLKIEQLKFDSKCRNRNYFCYRDMFFAPSNKLNNKNWKCFPKKHENRKYTLFFDIKNNCFFSTFSFGSPQKSEFISQCPDIPSYINTNKIKYTTH